MSVNCIANKRYKSVIYSDYPEYSMIEFDLQKNEISNSQDWIEKISEFIELLGYKRYKYVLFNKSKVDFEIKEKLYQFAQKNIIETIFNYGVEIIFFMVTEDRYKIYLTKPHEKIKIFRNYNELFEYLKNS